MTPITINKINQFLKEEKPFFFYAVVSSFCIGVLVGLLLR